MERNIKVNNQGLLLRPMIINRNLRPVIINRKPKTGDLVALNDIRYHRMNITNGTLFVPKINAEYEVFKLFPNNDLLLLSGGEFLEFLQDGKSVKITLSIDEVINKEKQVVKLFKEKYFFGLTDKLLDKI